MAASSERPGDTFATIDAPAGTIQVDRVRSSRATRYRRRKRTRMATAMTLACVVLLVAVVAAIVMRQAPTRKPPQFASVQDLQTFTGEPLRQSLRLVNATQWAGKVTFELIHGPSGAVVDPQSGVFSWRPAGASVQRHKVTVRVFSNKDRDLGDSATFWVSVRTKNRKPVIKVPEELQVASGETLQLKLDAHDPDSPATPLRFTLLKGPSGATIDAQTGQLTWKADENLSSDSVSFAVSVREDQPSGLSSLAQFKVTIRLPESPIDPVIAALDAQGLQPRLDLEGFAHSFQGEGATLLIGADAIRFIEYDTADAAREDLAKLEKDRDSLTMSQLPESWTESIRYFPKDRLLLMYAGSNEELRDKLIRVLGNPLVFKEASSAASSPGGTTGKTPLEEALATEFTDDEITQLIALYENGQLFHPRNYAILRSIYSARFERAHAQAIKEVFGSDAEIQKWLADNSDVKEEFFTAIDPEVDDIAQCLQLFLTLHKEFPDQFRSYANLAIAIAVSWDRERAIRTEAGPLRQAKAVAPPNPATAVDTFAYFLQSEQFMQGRVQLMPWEFLIHVVNHTTPLDERQWALQNYLGKRVMFGACYKTVPYDQEMLNSKGQVGRIHGKVYTLPNILQFGGVCAHQADFAARVGKCLGVPTAYVSGESAFGERHAWVMWVELKAITPKGIRFTLESYGRYRGDKYYVGRLREPQSGQMITDRELELRLHTIGIGPTQKRQADWVMDTFEAIREKKSLSVVQQFLYFRDTLELCPGTESAWIALSKMASKPEVQEKHRRDMRQVLDQLFTTFANFPDFTWTVFDDLIAFQDSLDKRIDSYGRLVSLYEVQGRPDLACEARLRLADMLVKNSEAEKAIQGLAFSIKKFPGEGRYVPRMLDKLESICNNANVAREQLVPFYNSFLPLIPQMRGSRPSPYCIKMFERGIERFQEAGQTQLAQLYAAQLERIRAGQGRR